MRDVLRPLVGTLGIACLATGLTVLSTGGALAQPSRRRRARWLRPSPLRRP